MNELNYQYIGQYDQLFQVSINTDRSFIVESGGYKSTKPRHGYISLDVATELELLIAQIPESYRNEDESLDPGFVNKLSINYGKYRASFKWFGPHTQSQNLNEIIVILKSI